MGQKLHQVTVAHKLCWFVLSGKFKSTSCVALWSLSASRHSSGPHSSMPTSGNILVGNMALVGRLAFPRDGVLVVPNVQVGVPSALGAHPDATTLREQGHLCQPWWPWRLWQQLQQPWRLWRPWQPVPPLGGPQGRAPAQRLQPPQPPEALGLQSLHRGHPDLPKTHVQPPTLCHTPIPMDNSRRGTLPQARRFHLSPPPSPSRTWQVSQRLQHPCQQCHSPAEGFPSQGPWLAALEVLLPQLPPQTERPGCLP
mmetsp:Transcript_28419/g.45869  ORF Transcript_28419/g.45869 Transcript_28419/m.45869 type:complete len:254 (-) Transcript_28419:221-982(-)